MKNLAVIFFAIFTIIFLQNCRTTKKINNLIASKITKDSATNKIQNTATIDSIKIITETVAKMQSHYINFKTFNAKIKVQYEDNNGKSPDITAVVRVIKDSAIWVSLSASVLNVEVFRALITKDSVILMDIRNKEAQYRSIDYLQEITQIPFNYKTLENLLVGNPIFFDSTVESIKLLNTKILLYNTGNVFKNLVTISTDNYLLLHSKLDDMDTKRNRTADITYGDFEKLDSIYFSTYREITVSEKNKLDITLYFKQYEFNKELSVSFKVPKIYTRK